MEAYNTIPILIYGLNSAVPAYVFTHSMKMVFFSKAYFITPSAKKAIDCAHVESLQRYCLLCIHMYPYIHICFPDFKDKIKQKQTKASFPKPDEAKPDCILNPQVLNIYDYNCSLFILKFIDLQDKN